MASKKDLIDAQGFSRRRLLTAFTSGAPGGKELEPAKPLRAVIAGVSLAALVLLGGVFYGMARPGLPNGWENNLFILVRDTGARFVTADGTLYPVINATSARLLIPAENYSIATVDRTSISGVPVGPTVGILGAPDDVPGSDDLENTLWTACPTDDGTAVSVPGDGVAVAGGEGTLVRSDGDLYLIAGGKRYPVPAADADAVVRAIGLAGVRPIDVDGRWLNLFPAGAVLAPLDIDHAGEGVAGSSFAVGTVLHPQGGTTRFVLTGDNELAPLSPLAYQMYLLGTGVLLGGEREVTPGEISAFPNAENPAGGADWPSDPLTPVMEVGTLCAQLTHDETGTPTTVLVTTDQAPTEASITVVAGTGALVAAGGVGDQSYREVFLIDASGTAFALPGADSEILARLGYSPSDVSLLDNTWLQFFPTGPALTIAAAGIPVGSDATAGIPVGSDTTAETPVGSDATATAVDDTLVGTLSSDEDETCKPGIVVFSPSTPTALGLLQTDDVWEVATGAGVTVAVVDSGIDVSNPHLTGVVIGGVNFVGDGERSDGMSDPGGHGTAVAGLIAAQLIPQSGVVGLAPDARLLTVRVFRGTDDQSIQAGFGPNPSRLAAGIRWATDNGAQIINVSLSDETDDPEVAAAVEYAESHGALVVASAGNRNTTTETRDTIRFPAAYPQALAVTATTTTGQVTDDSIHGVHVEIAAPGMDILTSTTGGGDCVYAGSAPSSSFATGYVSAAAALVAQAFPHETPAQWKYRLIETAIRVNPDERDDISGWGFVQPFDALMLEPGTVQRGPFNPFSGEVGAVSNPAAESLTSTRSVSLFAPTVVATSIIAFIAVTLLGSLGTIRIYRERKREVPPEVDDIRPGMLDRRKDELTRLVP